MRYKCPSTFGGVEHGLWIHNEAFFHWNPELVGLGRQIGQINSGAFGVFSVELSAPILVVQWVPCPCFPLFNHYFYKNLSHTWPERILRSKSYK
jgi:hypothetical protein